MADFGQVSPGQKSNLPTHSASWINTVSQMANAYQGQAAGGTNKGSKPAHSIDRNSVKIKNLTASDLIRGHCVQLGEFELDAKDPRKIWFEGNLYDEESESRVAIVTNAVKEDKRVDAVLIGIAVAVVDVTDTDHRFAAPEDGEYVLKSAASGTIEILDEVTGTGVQDCAVLLAASGGGATVTGGYGVLIANLPPATYDEGPPAVVTPGQNSAAVIPLELGDDLKLTQSGDAVIGLNPSFMTITGGIIVSGNLVVLNEGTEEEDTFFVVDWSDYKWGVPGWNGNPQSLGHNEDSEDMEWQDDGECDS